MKRALVTGSTQGIGYEIAKKLVEEGYEVIIHCSNDQIKADSIKKEIGAYNSIVCDLSDLSQTELLFEKTGPVDVLILNASVQYKNDWSKVSVEELTKQFNVNVLSSYLLIQKYYPSMKDKHFGRIITIGSVNQHNNHPELTIYGSTKNAQLYFVKNIAKQVAKDGITINNIAPGAIHTPRNEAIYQNESLRKGVEDKIPVGRFGEPSEIANLVSMILSNTGDYITGADLYIDGGLSL